MSAIVDISTAVAALLTTGKAAGWFDGFPAIGVIERQWAPNWEPADVQTLRIGVAPRGQDRERLARMVDTVEPVVLIGIMARLPATADIDDPTTIDPYANIAVRIAEIIASGILPAPATDAKLVSVAHVVVDPDMIRQRVFYSLITTTWRVAEAVRIGLPPAPTVAPVLTGTPAVGETLTCGTGTWLYGPTGYAYAWLVDGVADPSLGSASTLVLTADLSGSSISCVVTASNAAGSAVSSPSNALAVVASLPAITGAEPSTISASDPPMAQVILTGSLAALAGASATAYGGGEEVALQEGANLGWEVLPDERIILYAGNDGPMPLLLAAGAVAPFTFYVRFAKDGQHVDSPEITVTA